MSFHKNHRDPGSKEENTDSMTVIAPTTTSGELSEEGPFFCFGGYVRVVLLKTLHSLQHPPYNPPKHAVAPLGIVHLSAPQHLYG